MQATQRVKTLKFPTGLCSEQPNVQVNRLEITDSDVGNGTKPLSSSTLPNSAQLTINSKQKKKNVTKLGTMLLKHLNYFFLETFLYVIQHSSHSVRTLNTPGRSKFLINLPCFSLVRGKKPKGWELWVSCVFRTY